MKRSIVIIAAGDIPARVIKRLKKGLPGVFSLPVRAAAVRRPPARALNKMRNQYDAIKIIESMLEHTPPDAEKTLMVVNEDLFIPVLTHVIGEAQLGGTAGVLSLHRLLRDMPESGAAREILAERALKEAVHELGHTFGMTHCRDFLCPMSVTADAAGVDRKSSALCGACGFLLDKRRDSRLVDRGSGKTKKRTTNHEPRTTEKGA